MIVRLEKSEVDNCVYAFRDDGARLRLKGRAPSYIIAQEAKAQGFVEARYDPIAAVNAWLGFS